ncbi:hypothetical protein MOMMJLID_CDS0005 [Arthrobacter phage 1191A]|nr:hypothetical protein MOMMJLID_CDS0005 [Arthrobacter phage 1191A]
MSPAALTADGSHAGDATVAPLMVLTRVKPSDPTDFTK